MCVSIALYASPFSMFAGWLGCLYRVENTMKYTKICSCWASRIPSLTLQLHPQLRRFRIWAGLLGLNMMKKHSAEHMCAFLQEAKAILGC
jgi:hypothetical protein